MPETAPGSHPNQAPRLARTAVHPRRWLGCCFAYRELYPRQHGGCGAQAEPADLLDAGHIEIDPLPAVKTKSCGAGPDFGGISPVLVLHFKVYAKDGWRNLSHVFDDCMPWRVLHYQCHGMFRSRSAV
jgi:hypothetical protein